MSVTLGGRKLGTLARAILQPQHYAAAAKMFRVYPNPVEMYSRYLLRRGSYPSQIRVRTPLGALSLTAHCHDDVLTVNEIFCRLDYRADADDKVVVDFGSNIGISAAYFLSRSAASRVYLYEPLLQNIERLKHNLAPFAGRYELTMAAVGLNNGQAEFGWEPTGRYGGIGKQDRQGMNRIVVDCFDSNEVLERIATHHGRIDILKIDVETLEYQLTSRLTPSLASRIRRIYVEYRFDRNPLQETHDYQQRGSVACFRNRQV